MELERNPQTRSRDPGSGATGDDNLDEVRAHLEGLFQAADQALGAIRPIQAEEYLQQHRQRGAE